MSCDSQELRRPDKSSFQDGQESSQHSRHTNPILSGGYRFATAKKKLILATCNNNIPLIYNSYIHYLNTINLHNNHIDFSASNNPTWFSPGLTSSSFPSTWPPKYAPYSTSAEVASAAPETLQCLLKTLIRQMFPHLSHNGSRRPRSLHRS